MANILLIDDEKSIRITIAEFLKDAQHTVTTAATAEEALELVRAQQFDVIITDIILPRINGLDLIRQFKQIAPGSEYIIISGEPNVTSVTEALRMGVFDFLPKPVTAQDIINVVKNASEIKNLRDAKQRLEKENLRYREHLEKLVAARTAELIKTNQALEAEIKLRAKAQEELERSKEELALVINSLPLLIAYIDRELKILMLNETFQHLMQRVPIADLGSPFRTIIGEENWSQLAPRIDAVLNGQQEFFTANLTFDTEQNGFYRIYLIPHKDTQDQVQAFIFLAEDITTISTIEHEYFRMQRLESLSTLAEGIANDVNNSLMVIFGNLALVKTQTERVDPMSDALANIEQSAEKIKDLTRQLLSYSWKRPMSRSVVDLDSLIQKTLSFFAKEHQYNYHYASPVESIKVFADQGRLYQAFYNLIRHLCEVMGIDSALAIILQSCEIPNHYQVNLAPGKYAHLQLKIARELFAPEEIPYIFEPYYRFKRTNIRLDLATMYATLLNHGGTILARVEEGATWFNILLPVYTEETTPPPECAVKADFTYHYVLLMDDEASVMEILGRMLEQLNCRYEMTTNGDKAVELARQRLQEGHPFDLAILDLFIPSGRGATETVGALKALDPSIKVVVSSGFHLDPVLNNYQEFGFNAAIRKPFDVEGLKQILASIF